MSLPSDDHESSQWVKAMLTDWVWRITPNCREVARLTSEGRDHALPLGVRTRLGLHRLFCKWCARYAKQLELLHEATHLLPEHLDQADGRMLNTDTKARFKRALREQMDQ